jgi:hypothetical protein
MEGDYLAGIDFFDDDLFFPDLSLILLGVYARLDFTKICTCDCWLCFNFYSDYSRSFCFLYL